jgi:hypothetical protein
MRLISRAKRVYEFRQRAHLDAQAQPRYDGVACYPSDQRVGALLAHRGFEPIPEEFFWFSENAFEPKVMLAATSHAASCRRLSPHAFASWVFVEEIVGAQSRVGWMGDAAGNEERRDTRPGATENRRPPRVSDRPRDATMRLAQWGIAGGLGLDQVSGAPRSRRVLTSSEEVVENAPR